ncbi:NfeD family protein [Bacillus horti]|uniref:Membrane-bound ClpP family serine protease n=1 Tax=Caldalkalibacillus horti TaxID=77523 RepID=A0ABT9VX11_9BACI|nr:NfeD family protein [Bacillus horti]MDQ0165526.1 membrane-bound ClpP family serine protease [Bacillus horti]
METVYLICFFVGFLYAIVSIIFGNIFDIEFDIEGGSLPYLSPTTIAAFVTVFGGTGVFLSYVYALPTTLTLLISIFLALVGAAIMFFVVVLPLYKAQKSSAFSNRDMIGRTGEVTTIILEQGRGEVIYEQGGSRLTAPALSYEGTTIRQGELVEIVDVISGTFVVKKLND